MSSNFIVPFYLQRTMVAGDVTVGFALMSMPISNKDIDIEILNIDIQGGTPFCICQLGYEQNSQNPNIKTLRTGYLGAGGDKLAWSGPVKVKCFNIIGFVRPVVAGNLIELRGAYREL